MRAKHFTWGDKQEMVLENGKSYKSMRNESLSAFTDRIINKVANEELESLEIILVNKKSLDSLPTSLLKNKYLTAEGLQKEMLQDLLKSKGINISGNTFSEVADESSNNPKNQKQVETKTENATPKKGKVAKGKVTKGKVESSKAEAKPKAEKEKAAKPEPMTKEQREAAIAAFKETPAYQKPFGDIGKEVVYSTKNTKHGKGVIKSLSINKKLTKVYYTVQNTETKKRECVTLDNVEFTKKK
jgi:hypothetical protein